MRIVEGTERDPVCGMEIDDTAAAGRRRFGAQTFYFCSHDCLVAFDHDPGRYVPSSRHRPRDARALPRKV